MRYAMSKYSPLGEHLRAQQSDSCVLTFSQVEEIIGAPLPASARRREQWWGNDKTHTQACSWMQAGWKVRQPRLIREQVCFSRNNYQPPSSGGQSTGKAVSQVVVRNLDARVVVELKQRARRNGRSLEQELRVILARAARPGRRELIAEADRIRAMTAGPLEDSVSLLRQARDNR